MIELRAEMSATVWKVVASPGDVLSPGDTVVILESMKMEIPVITEQQCTVDTIAVAEGSTLQEGDLIATLQ